MSRFSASSWETQQPSATVCEVPAFRVCFAQFGHGPRKRGSNSLACRIHDLEYGSPGVFQFRHHEGSFLRQDRDQWAGHFSVVQAMNKILIVSLWSLRPGQAPLTDLPVMWYAFIVNDHHGASGNIVCNLHPCYHSQSQSQ